MRSIYLSNIKYNNRKHTKLYSSMSSDKFNFRSILLKLPSNFFGQLVSDLIPISVVLKYLATIDCWILHVWNAKQFNQVQRYLYQNPNWVFSNIVRLKYDLAKFHKLRDSSRIDITIHQKCNKLQQSICESDNDTDI